MSEPGIEPSIPPEQIQTYLSAQSAQPVRLVITNNRWSLLSLRRNSTGGAVVRAARIFLSAPEAIWRAIAVCLRRREREAWRQIRHFINEAASATEVPHAEVPRRRVRLVTRGRVYDLAEISQRIADRYFGGTLSVGITWGRAPARLGRRRITFGTYHHVQNLVRIHPRLDDPRVPEYFVEYIVFHELLHAAMGQGGDNVAGRRRVIHSREFRRREKEFADYKRAMAWEKENLRLFLR